MAGRSCSSLRQRRRRENPKWSVIVRFSVCVHVSLFVCVLVCLSLIKRKEIMSVLSSVHQFVRPCISPFVRASVRLSVRSAVRLSVRLFDRRSAMLPLWHVRHLVTSDSVDCRSASTVGQRQLSDRVDCRTVRHSDGPTNTNFHQMADTRRSDSTCRSVGRSDGIDLVVSLRCFHVYDVHNKAPMRPTVRPHD